MLEVVTSSIIVTQKSKHVVSSNICNVQENKTNTPKNKTEKSSLSAIKGMRRTLMQSAF